MIIIYIINLYIFNYLVLNCAGFSCAGFSKIGFSKIGFSPCGCGAALSIGRLGSMLAYTCNPGRYVTLLDLKFVVPQRLFCTLVTLEYKHTIPLTIEGYKRYIIWLIFEYKARRKASAIVTAEAFLGVRVR